LKNRIESKIFKTVQNLRVISKSAGLRPLGVRLPLPAPQIVKKLSEFL